MRKRDIGSGKWGDVKAPAWRALLAELPTWSFSAAASAKQLPQKIMLGVGRRKRNGQEYMWIGSDCNPRVLVLMGRIYQCTVCEFFKRPDLTRELRHNQRSGSGLACEEVSGLLWQGILIVSVGVLCCLQSARVWMCGRKFDWQNSTIYSESVNSTFCWYKVKNIAEQDHVFIQIRS